MFWFAELVLLAICMCIGGAAGFYEQWRKGPPPPVTVLYCRPSDTDARCVEALKRYKAEHPDAASPFGSAAPAR